MSDAIFNHHLEGIFKIEESILMATEVLDTRGLRCPQPVLKIAEIYVDMKQGDVLEVIGDCPTFEKNIRTWCERMGKTFLFCRNEDSKGALRCQIQF